MQLFLLICLVLSASQMQAKQNKQNDTFVATNEWQEIREGQGIPAGLHVRINLQTGKKEAKLLDPNEQGATDLNALNGASNSSNHTQQPDESKLEQSLKLSKTLTKAIKQLASDLAIEHKPQLKEQPSSGQQSNYKSYEELKQSFAEMRKSFKTDAEILQQLIGEFRNLSKADAELELNLEPGQTKTNIQLQILENFDYLVHQIDNALLFIDLGGLQHVLLPVVVNETHVNLRVQALRVLGALTQNNPKAQIKVFEQNFASHLSQTLISSANTEELSASLYAFGSLLRKFPHAQQRILSTYGMQALIAILSKKCELKIKAKAAALISDLLIEKQLAASTAAEQPAAAAQYAQVLFEDWLQAHAYCSTFNTVMSSNLLQFIEQADQLEYFAQALEQTYGFCATTWSKDAQLRHTLLTLRNRYARSDDEYRLELAQQLNKLIKMLYIETDADVHDEL